MGQTSVTQWDDSSITPTKADYEAFTKLITEPWMNYGLPTQLLDYIRNSLEPHTGEVCDFLMRGLFLAKLPEYTSIFLLRDSVISMKIDDADKLANGIEQYLNPKEKTPMNLILPRL